MFYRSVRAHPIALHGGVLITPKEPDLKSQIHRFMYWIICKAKQKICFVEKNVSFRLLAIPHSLYETHEQESLYIYAVSHAKSRSKELICPSRRCRGRDAYRRDSLLS